MPIRLNFTNTRTPTLSIPLDLADVTILDAYLDDQGACQITVESTVDQVLCHRCVAGHHRFARLWRAGHRAPFGRVGTAHLCHAPLPPLCLPPLLLAGAGCDHHPDGGLAARGSPHTHAYEDHVLLQLVNSTLEDVGRKGDSPPMRCRVSWSAALPPRFSGPSSSG